MNMEKVWFNHVTINTTMCTMYESLHVCATMLVILKMHRHSIILFMAPL